MERTPIDPVLRTTGLFVPVLHWWLVCDQFETISRLAREARCRSFPAVWLALAVAALDIAWSAAVMVSPYPFWLLNILDSLASLPLFMLVQRTLDDYWRVVEASP